MKRQIVRNRANIGEKLAEGDSGGQDATRRRARGTRRGPEARDKIPRRGEGHRRASTDLQRSYNGAATGVIFGVDVVPLSILASYNGNTLA